MEPRKWTSKEGIEYWVEDLEEGGRRVWKATDPQTVWLFTAAQVQAAGEAGAKGRSRQEQEAEEARKLEEDRVTLGRRAVELGLMAEAGTPKVKITGGAWAKMLWFCLKDNVEISGFGISRPGQLLTIDEFVTVKQEVSVASIKLDDVAVADFFEDQVAAGRKPVEFGRIWLHTHPGNGVQPSGPDLETFREVFGKCDWALMLILGRKGAMSARLRVAGTGRDWLLDVEVEGMDGWAAEYDKHVQREAFVPRGGYFGDQDWEFSWDNWRNGEQGKDDLRGILHKFEWGVAARELGDQRLGELFEALYPEQMAKHKTWREVLKRVSSPEELEILKAVRERHTAQPPKSNGEEEAPKLGLSGLDRLFNGLGGTRWRSLVSTWGEQTVRQLVEDALYATWWGVEGQEWVVALGNLPAEARMDVLEDVEDQLELEV